MKKKLYIYQVWQYILIYTAISFGGMAMPIIIGKELFVILTFIIGLAYCLYKGDVLNNKYLLFVLILTSSLFTTLFASNLSIGSTLSITSTLLFTYAVIVADSKNFLKRYLTIMFIIATTSIVLYTLTRLFGTSFFSPIFPYLLKGLNENNPNGIYSFGGFLYRWTFIHSERNCGPFGGPGQYQGVLSVALYFALYNKRIFNTIKEQMTYIVVFTIAMITTLSTNGYIALSIIYIGYFLQPHHRNRIKKQVIKLLYTILALLLFTELGKNFLKIAIYDKFFDSNQLSITTNTTGARTHGIIEMYHYVLNNPIAIWGLGYDSLHDLNFDTVSGLPLLLLAIGIIPFTTLFIGILQLSKYSAQSTFEYIIKILLFLSMGFGQPHIINPSLFFMLFYEYIRRIDWQTLCHKTNKN